FDIQMSEHSHGFREGRGCGSALREIYYTWRGSTWLIEGDIADCFGTLSHELLISRLRERFHDGRFIHLVKKLLDAGYLEDWRFHRTLDGVPQGSILVPHRGVLRFKPHDKRKTTTPNTGQRWAKKGNVDWDVVGA